jgi:hypothetical protein
VDQAVGGAQDQLQQTALLVGLQIRVVPQQFSNGPHGCERIDKRSGVSVLPWSKAIVVLHDVVPLSVLSGRCRRVVGR